VKESERIVKFYSDAGTGIVAHPKPTNFLAAPLTGAEDFMMGSQPAFC